MTAGLASLGTRGGLVLGLALDHRDSLDVILRSRGLGALGVAAIRQQKAAIVGSLAPSASAVMLDHEYGALAIDAGACGGAALIMPLEEQGYAALGDVRPVHLMADFSPGEARHRGAAACKLLVSMRPDRPAFTDDQLATATLAVAASHEAGLPILLEPLVYRLTGESEPAFRRRYPGLVAEATVALAGVGADLLKLPVPVRDPDTAALAGPYQRMADACGGRPWVLYGAGMAIDALCHQLALAGDAGASGFLVGRTIWADLLAPDPATTAAAARLTGRRRFDRLVEVATASCQPLPVAEPVTAAGSGGRSPVPPTERGVIPGPAPAAIPTPVRRSRAAAPEESDDRHPPA